MKSSTGIAIAQSLGELCVLVGATVIWGLWAFVITFGALCLLNVWRISTRA